MKALFLVAGLAFAVATPQQAQAYCCKVRPDVCKGICGSTCCGGQGKLSAGGCGADMSKVPTASLQAELKAAGRTDAAFSKLVRAELSRRAAPRATKRTAN